MPLKSISVNVETPVAVILVVDNLVIVETPTELINPVTLPVTLPVRFPCTLPVTPPTNAPVNVVAVTAVPLKLPKKVVEVTAVPVRFPLNVVAVNDPRTVESCSVSKIFDPV